MAEKMRAKLTPARIRMMEFIGPRLKAIEWFVAVMLFVFSLSGFAAFIIRPPEKGTFSARFGVDTSLQIREIQNECIQNVMIGNVSGVALPKPFGRPIDLILPMDPQEFEKLASALEIGCQQCNSIKASMIKLELGFNQPLSVSIVGHGASAFSIIRSEDGTAAVTVTASTAEAGANQHALLELKVTGAQFYVTVKADGRKLGEFSLHPRSGMTNTLSLLPVVPWPHVQGTIQLLYPSKEIDFEAEVCVKQIEVENTPEGILTLGPLVQKVGWGERLQLSMDRHLPVRVEKEKITLDARHCQNAGTPRLPGVLGEEPCITGAMHNDVVELLPPWFSLWYDWVRGIWQSVAVAFIYTAFIAILKHLKLWPSS